MGILKLNMTMGVRMSDSILVWLVVEGPYSVEDDLPEDEEYPEGFSHWVVCMITDGPEGEPYYEDMWFTSFEDAYAFKREVDWGKEPLEIADE